MDRPGRIAPVEVGAVSIGGPRLVVIAGPCLAESRAVCREVAAELVAICAELDLPYIFKASYDKANRSSAASARGAGLDEGLALLEGVRAEFGVPATTDVHLPEEAATAAQVVDLLQIPAFLCRQLDLLNAAAATGRPVNVKKGQFLAPADARNIVENLRAARATGIVLTERGATFGYNSLVVDMPGLEIMRGLGVPVCFDATHSAQRPGALGATTGGARETIPALTRAAVAVGLDALFFEAHPDPARAASDAATQLPLSQARALLESAVAIDRAWRG